MNIDLRIADEDDINFLIDSGHHTDGKVGRGGMVSYHPRYPGMSKVITLWCMEHMSVEYLEQDIERIISHETLHSVLASVIGPDASGGLDNLETTERFSVLTPFSYPDDIILLETAGYDWRDFF